jgi:ABC transporter substrate binding protein
MCFLDRMPMRSSNQWRHMLRNHLRRREFIAMLGSAAAAWPLTARAQQSAMPVIGFLSGTPREPATSLVAAVQRGLAEAGYFEGRTLSIEYRWAEDQYGRLPELAADLVRRQVAVIVALNSPAALAAKRATTSGVDPVTSGLVDSFNRPSGNATGLYILTTSLEAKRLEFLHEAKTSADALHFPIIGAADPPFGTVACAGSHMCKVKEGVNVPNVVESLVRPNSRAPTCTDRNVRVMPAASNPARS